MADARRVPLVYLAGMGRSGSTMLDRLLGQQAGWWSLGEVVHLWQRGLVDNERCGCGERFWSCPVWQSIGEAAFGGWEQLDVEHVLSLRASVERDRFLPQLVSPTSSFRDRLRDYHDVLYALYDGARRATGARVVVDASKHVSTAVGLRHARDVDLHVVHLVRDSRGVAYSWMKSVARPSTDGEQLMAQWSPLETSLRYLGYNSVLGASFRDRRQVVRYEDLVGDPGSVLRGIVGRVEQGPQPTIRDVDGQDVDFRVSHGLSGNPMRSRGGTVTLRLDDAWRREMSTGTRRLVTGVTLPTLVRHGYPVLVDDDAA